MNIYLYGHGKMTTASFFSLPKNVSVQFYCHPFKAEPRIVSLNILKGKSDNFEYIETKKPYQQCHEHILIATDMPRWYEAKSIFLGNDSSQLFGINEYHEKGRHDIQQENLSDIILNFTEYYENEFSEFKFHWCSCRRLHGLNSKGGSALGINAGDHMNDARKDKHGFFAIRSRAGKVKSWFHN